MNFNLSHPIFGKAWTVAITVALLCIVVCFAGGAEAAQWLTSKSAIYLVAFLIAAAAFACAIYYGNAVQDIITQLQQFRALVAESGSDWERLRGEAEGNVLVRDAFKRFDRGVRIDEFKDESRIVTEPVEDFINPNALYFSQLEVHFYRSVPGMLTGLGLLFTFVGLAAGIYLAYNAEGRDNFDSAVKQLLSGAGQAFVSSIVGLVGSLLFQAYIKFSENKVFAEIQGIVSEIDKHVLFRSPEYLQYETLLLIRNQGEKVDELGTSWNNKMEEVFDKMLAEQSQMTKEMSDRLVGAIDRIDLALQAMSQNQVEHILSVLQEASEAFSKMLGDRIQEMTEDFSKTASNLTQAANTLEQVFGVINDRISEASQTTQAHIAAIEEEFTKIEAGMRAGGEAAESALSDASQRVSQMSEEIRSTAESLKNTLDGASSGFKTTIDEAVSGLSQSLAGTSEDFKTAMAETSGAFKSVIASSGSEFEGSMKTTSESFAKTLNDAADHAAEVLGDALAKTGESLKGQVGEAAEGITTMLEGIKEQMEKQREVVLQLERAAAGIGSQASMFEETLVNMAKQQKAFAETATTLQEAVRGAADGIGESQRNISEELLDQARVLTEQQQGIIKTAERVQSITTEHLTNIAQSLKAMHDKVGSILTESDSGLSQAVGSMSGALNSWIEHQAEANKDLSNNIDELRTVLKTLPSVRPAVPAREVR